VIKTLIFDLGGVIVPFDIKRGYAKIAPLCNCAPAEIPARVRSTDLVRRFESGRLSSEDFVRELSALLEMRTTYAEFCDLWNTIFLPETLIPESLISELAQRYQLLVLSNTNPIHFSALEAKYPLLQHFHDYVLSYEVGALKPAPEIYQAAIARSGCAAGECFFTDDILVNVEGASAQGMDAVQFQSAAQIERELRARSVL
jgi:glucose-1-phosphatase